MRIIARLNVGGPALHVMNLCAGQADRYPTLLVTGQVGADEADLFARAEARGLDVIRVPQLGRRLHPASDLVAFVKLLRLLIAIRPEIVHTHTAKAGALGRLAALIAGVPVRVHTYHGHVLEGYFGRVRSKLAVWVERMLALLTTRVVVISRSQLEDLAVRFRIAPRERFALIPLGLDLRRFERVRPEDGRAFREEIAADGPIVSIVGRLVPIKNHRLFLRAAATVLARRPDVTFVVVGGGAMEAELREQARALQIEGRVRFLGWRDDLPGIYAGSDLVVLTSRNEGTPVSLIEAMSTGTPVLATAVGGVPDILEHGALGRLVPDDDADAFARAIAEELESPVARQRAQRARAAIPERFADHRLVADMNQLYDRLLELCREGSVTSNPVAEAGA